MMREMAKCIVHYCKEALSGIFLSFSFFVTAFTFFRGGCFGFQHDR